MFCTSCGTKNVAENNFCRQCGHKFEKVASTIKISEDEFDRALPEDEQVMALLERAYRQRKENDLPRAIALCEDALKISPDSTTGHSLLGQLYEATGDRDQAIRQYERVLELNPGSIADRVKLDQLRGGTTPMPAGSGKPRITMVDHDGSRIPSSVFIAVGLALILILLGGMLALQFRPHPNELAQNTLTPGKPGSLEATTTLNPSTRTSAVTGIGNASPNGQIASSQAGSNNQQQFGGSIPYGYPGLIYQPGGGPSTSGRSQKANASQAGSISGFQDGPIKVMPVSGIANPTSGDSDTVNAGKVRLKTSDGDGGDQIPIPIIKGRVFQDPHPGTGSSGSDPNGDSGSARADAANPASADSRAFIAIGQDLMNRQDYAKALVSFQKAVPSAFDETAYVYEQIAHCYKGKSDNKNAGVWYERARDKYKGMLGAGRQAEAARNGIRACENGIKICSGE